MSRRILVIEDEALFREQLWNTGYVQPELFARVLEQRSAPLEVLYKPVSLEKIRTLVERYLARHP